MFDLSKLFPSRHFTGQGKDDNATGTSSTGSKAPLRRSAGGGTTSASASTSMTMKDNNLDLEKSAAASSAHDEEEAISVANAPPTRDQHQQQQTAPARPSPPSFPEGGLQAWLTVIGGYVREIDSCALSC